jgi:hypothetical protein
MTDPCGTPFETCWDEEKGVVTLRPLLLRSVLPLRKGRIGAVDVHRLAGDEACSISGGRQGWNFETRERCPGSTRRVASAHVSGARAASASIAWRIATLLLVASLANVICWGARARRSPAQAGRGGRGCRHRRRRSTSDNAQLGRDSIGVDNHTLYVLGAGVSSIDRWRDAQ